MAKKAIIALKREGLRFRVDMFLRWHKGPIGFPMIRHDWVHQGTLDRTPELFPRDDAPGPVTTGRERFPSRSTAIQPSRSFFMPHMAVKFVDLDNLSAWTLDFLQVFSKYFQPV